MTTIAEAIKEFPTDRLQAVAETVLTMRTEAVGDRPWSALWNALLCVIVDEQSARSAAEAELFDRHLIPLRGRPNRSA